MNEVANEFLEHERVNELIRELPTGPQGRADVYAVWVSAEPGAPLQCRGVFLSRERAFDFRDTFAIPPFRTRITQTELSP